MKKPDHKKIFVLDTNVLLHDHRCIYNFEENDIVIPIVVLEELDRFKKGNDLINFQAREFVRDLDKLAGDLLLTKGISLGVNKGTLTIEPGKKSEAVHDAFPENTSDHRILATADFVKKSNPKRAVVLITKDINLRMKAKSLGIPAEDYENDKVQNISELFKTVITLEGVDDVLVSGLYENFNGIPIEDFKFDKEPHPHQYFILKSRKASVLAHFDPINRVMNRVEKQQVYGIDPRNAEQTFSIDALSRPEIQLVALTGKAGTGKTLLALAAALQQKKEFQQIFLARPIVPLANKDIGFLPGDVNDKIGPYMQPLYDNLSVIKHKFRQQSPEFNKIEEMLKTEKLIITPLAYIRGRSLSN